MYKKMGIALLFVMGLMMMANPAEAQWRRRGGFGRGGFGRGGFGGRSAGFLSAIALANAFRPDPFDYYPRRGGWYGPRFDGFGGGWGRGGWGRRGWGRRGRWGRGWGW